MKDCLNEQIWNEHIANTVNAQKALCILTDKSQYNQQPTLDALVNIIFPDMYVNHYKDVESN